MPRKTKCPEELLDRGARMVFDSGRPIAHLARDLSRGRSVKRMSSSGEKPRIGKATLPHFEMPEEKET